MKKQVFIIIVLIVGVSFNSLAGTGGAHDGFQFFLAFIGFILFFLGLISGGNYLRKNGKSLICKTITSVKKMIISLKNYLHKIKSDYFDLSYF